MHLTRASPEFMLVLLLSVCSVVLVMLAKEGRMLPLSTTFSATLYKSGTKIASNDTFSKNDTWIAFLNETFSQNDTRIAYVITFNETSPQTVRSKLILESVGFEVQLEFAKPMEEKVLSNKLAQTQIYQKIIRNPTPWGYIFADDIALAVESFSVTKDVIHGVEKQHSLMNYLGICGPEKQRVTGMYCGKCTHAYGLSRLGARMLLKHNQRIESNGTHLHGESVSNMDVVTRDWCIRRGGFPVSFPHVTYEHAMADHVGAFFQDRKEFESIISTQLSSGPIKSEILRTEKKKPSTSSLVSNHSTKQVLLSPVGFLKHASDPYSSRPEDNDICLNLGSFFYSTNKSDSFNGSEYRFRYFSAPLGNCLVHYFNERAISFLRNQLFVAENTTTPEGMVGCFPTVVLPSNFVEDRQQLMRVLNAAGDQFKKEVLSSYDYPHTHPRAAWRLIPATIAYETRRIANAWASLPGHLREDVPGPNTVVVHTRCDDYILRRHREYGILPHRFILDRLPPDTHRVVIVRKPEQVENACLWSVQDLALVLEMERGIPVSFRQSASHISDWLYLTRSSTLMCSPSTFCLTAAWGNPNKVYMATNGKAALVARNDAMLTDIQSHLEFVEIDHIPGKSARKMSKETIIRYIRSSDCLPIIHNCKRSNTQGNRLSTNDTVAAYLINVNAT